MNKKYTFYDDSYYERPPCDCCPGYWMECYNSSDTDSSTRTAHLGSAHSEEDCYVQAIKTESNAYMEDDSLWELDLEQLKKIAEELGIVVEIIS